MIKLYSSSPKSPFLSAVQLFFDEFSNQPGHVKVSPRQQSTVYCLFFSLDTPLIDTCILQLS
jgi:hypothetical protein